MTQFLRPTSDLTNPGGWTTTPLFSKINETSQDGTTTQIGTTNPPNTTFDECTFSLTALAAAPGVDTGHTLNIWARKANTGVQLDMQAEILDPSGASYSTPIVNTWTNLAVNTTGMDLYTVTFSQSLIAQIPSADYVTGLRLAIRGRRVGTGTNRLVAVTMAEFQVPDAGVDAAVSFAGVGSVGFVGERIAEGSVSYAGIGAVSFAGQKVSDGSVSFAGVSVAAFSGQRVADGAVSYSGVGLVGFVGQRVADAIVSFAGLATISFTGDKVSGGGGTDGAVSFSSLGLASFTGEAVRSGSVAFAGVGLSSYAGEAVRQGAVAYSTVGAFTASGQRIAQGAVGFLAVGLFSVTGNVAAVATVGFATACTVVFTGSLVGQTTGVLTSIVMSAPQFSGHLMSGAQYKAQGRSGPQFIGHIL